MINKRGLNYLCFRVRKEFLEHLEVWRKEAVDRSESVMQAKVRIELF